VLATGCGAGGGAGAASSCVGPQLTLVPDRAAVGQEVTVGVEWLREGCDDHPGADEERPLTDVPVSFVQGATEVRLGTVSGTGDRHAGSVTVTVPSSAGPGPAEVRLGAGGRAGLTVLP
jgi:hypothetical protein